MRRILICLIIRLCFMYVCLFDVKLSEDEFNICGSEHHAL